MTIEDEKYLNDKIKETEMKKYIVVEVHDLKEFTVEVNQKIKQGYLPIGGIECPVRGLYTQAMIMSEVAVNEAICK